MKHTIVFNNLSQLKIALKILIEQVNFLFLILLVTFFIHTNSANAQDFLNCLNDQRTAIKDSQRTWIAQINSTIQKLEGDDSAAFLGVVPTVKLIDSPTLNAFSSPNGTVSITSGLLGLIDSNSELAFALGHELGHIALKHSKMALSEGKDIEKEKAADVFAIKLLKSLHFDWMAGKVLLGKIENARQSLNLGASDPATLNLQRRILALEQIEP